MIVAIAAAFVTRLQVIAVDCYYRAVGEIGKGPGDRCGRGVADDGEGASYVESGIQKTDQTRKEEGNLSGMVRTG